MHHLDPLLHSSLKPPPSSIPPLLDVYLRVQLSLVVFPPRAVDEDYFLTLIPSIVIVNYDLFYYALSLTLDLHGSHLSLFDSTLYQARRSRHVLRMVSISCTFFSIPLLTLGQDWRASSQPKLLGS